MNNVGAQLTEWYCINARRFRFALVIYFSDIWTLKYHMVVGRPVSCFSVLVLIVVVVVVPARLPIISFRCGDSEIECSGSRIHMCSYDGFHLLDGNHCDDQVNLWNTCKCMLLIGFYYVGWHFHCSYNRPSSQIQHPDKEFNFLVHFPC